MGTVIAVISGKGGTGKTTTVGAVSSCLASRGYKTLCIDCDIGLKNLDLVLGMTDIAFTDFNDVLEGNATLEEAAVEHTQIKNLFLLSAPSNISADEISIEHMKKLVAEAKKNFDYCFIDAPAGIGSGFRLASSTGADMAVVVTTGDASSLRDGQRVTAELAKTEISEIRLIVNRLKPNLLKQTRATIDDMIDVVGAQLIGIVTENETVMLAANMEKPLILCKDNRAMQQFNRIARRLAGEKIPLGKIKE